MKYSRKVVKRNNHEWPTPCDIQIPNEVYYRTGDVRTNLCPGLAAVQIVLMREHNRIADKLKEINPCWRDDDNKLYEEARRINIAQYQQITYYECLPNFLGYSNMMDRHLISENEPGTYVSDYNPRVDATMLNEHDTAAFRYYHSLVHNHLE